VMEIAGADDKRGFAGDLSIAGEFSLPFGS
jgi:hypothetical protein